MSDTGETRPEPALRFIIEDVKLFPSRDRCLYSQRSRVGTKKLQSMQTDQGPSTHQSVRPSDGPLRLSTLVTTWLFYFATDLAANFGCDQFRITGMPDIVCKLLRATI